MVGTMTSKFFKDLAIGDFFEGYGDQISNYNYPKICLFKKTGENTATEIEDGKETQHNLISDNTKVNAVTVEETLCIKCKKPIGDIGIMYHMCNDCYKSRGT